MNLPVIIIGGGGHAKVLAAALCAAGTSIVGITEADSSKYGENIFGIPIIGNDLIIEQYKQESIMLVNGIGSTRTTTARTAVFNTFKSKGYTFASVIHPSAIVASGATINEGAQIMAGAVIQTGAVIGENSIINTGAVVDHDCIVGNHVHIAPRAVLSGMVTVGDESHIGTGATIINGISIGKNCLIAAGAVVIKNVRDRATVMGVPAREVQI